MVTFASRPAPKARGGREPDARRGSAVRRRPHERIHPAVYAARAGHRSGKIAVIVSGLLLLATIVLMLLYGGWIGLAATAVAAVLVLAWVLSRRIAVVVSGLLLLATLASPRGRTAGGSM
jgi:hypothetical protein